jgi:hypothetical protein
MGVFSDIERAANNPECVALIESEKNRLGPRPDDIDTGLAYAAELDLHVKLLYGTSERGKRDVVFYLIGSRLDTMRVAIELWRNVDKIPRPIFQRAMGRLLGYSEADIADFLGSEIAETCPCTACGRNELEAAAAARRTQYHA